MGSPVDYPNVLKWSMFHATNVLASMAQVRDGNDPAVEKRCEDQLDAMNRHLAGRDWFADDYSIADIIPFTRISGLSHKQHGGVELSERGEVARTGRRAACCRESDGAEVRLIGLQRIARQSVRAG